MMDIIGERVRLRDFTRDEHHAFYQSYVADPVMDPNVYVYDAAKADAGYERICRQADWYPRVGIFLRDGAVIGELSFKRIDRAVGRCELGIALANDTYKGRGYGTEALRLALGYAFNDLGLQTVYADTMGGNAAMRHILGKLGFTFTGLEARRYDMGGRWDDKLYYRLSR